MPNNIIDKIRVSGTDYTLSATTSGVSVVEVTQAEYDALPSSAKTDTSKMYVITDAQAGDLTQYWTSAQTNSAITQATSGKADTSYVDQSVSGKVDTTTYTAYTAATNSALANKQTTLTAGTGIDITDNVISATGGGGGGMTEDDELLLSTALTDLNDRKIDASEVKSNYQKKGDYATKDYVTTALEPYETKVNVEQVEEVTAYALNDLNDRLGGLKITKITESEYAALTTKDENTLYIVVADPS